MKKLLVTAALALCAGALYLKLTEPSALKKAGLDQPKVSKTEPKPEKAVDGSFTVTVLLNPTFAP